MNSLPEGFYVPIHRSLTTKVMLGGIPRKIAIINGTMIISLVVGAHNLWVLPVGVLSHLVLVALHRRDQDILTVIKRNLNCPSVLRP
jgi:type IV secretory pathway TrbD component